MALQLGALLDALEDAGASKEKIAAAAHELAANENRLALIDTRLAQMAGRLRIVQVLCAIDIILTAGILWRLLAHT